MSATTTTTTKRHRDHDGDTQPPITKRQKDSYINLVHEKQEHEQQELETQEPMHDLSYLFASVSPDPFLEPCPDNDPTQTGENGNENHDDDEDDEKESVIRHLLEASDDELGLPKVVTQGGGGGDDVAEEMSYYGDICDGLWELEDEVANYYTLLQSQLFMH